MKNQGFLIWMLGYPLSQSFVEFINGEHYLLSKIDTTITEKAVIAIALGINFFVYFYVGHLLYEKKNG